jgi:FkbM family methyltransferase
MVLFDVGAHFGLFSLASLHYGGPRARAIAIEPSPTAVRILQLHARLNGVVDRLHVVRAAASDSPGWRPMLPVGVIADGYYIEPTRHHPRSDLVRVPAITLDTMVQELGFLPTHLKIDVEGAEAEVLRGAVATLTAPRPPIVFLELHNSAMRRTGRDSAAPLEFLSQQGYRFFRPEGSPLDLSQALQGPLVRLIAHHPRSSLPAPKR